MKNQILTKGLVKTLILSAVQFTVISAMAQGQLTPDQKKILSAKVDSMIHDYMLYSTMVGHNGGKRDDSATVKYSRLFRNPQASVPDEMQPSWFDSKMAKPTSGENEPPTESGRTIYTGSIVGMVPNFQKSHALVKKRPADSVRYYYQDLPQVYSYYDSGKNNMRYFHELLLNQETIHNRKLDDLLTSSRKNYPDGFSTVLLDSQISYRNIGNNEINVLLVKRIAGTIGQTGVQLENTDTLILHLYVNGSNQVLLIDRIDLIGYQYRFINDRDRDFVADVNDRCPDVQGFQEDGCPIKATTITDSSLYVADRKTTSVPAAKADNTAFSSVSAETTSVLSKDVVESEEHYYADEIAYPSPWWLTAGLNGGLFSGSGSSNKPGYKNLIVSPSTYQNPTSKFSRSSFFSADLALERFFGERQKLGVSIGLMYTRAVTQARKSPFQVQYQAYDSRGDTYRQIIVATSPVSEKDRISNWTIPLLFVYKGDPERNDGTGFGIKLEGGIGLNVRTVSKLLSTPKGTFNYEAVYAYANNTPTLPATVYDSSVPYAPTSWVITTDRVPAKENPDDYFNGLHQQGYPVALGVSAGNMIKHKTTDFNVGYSLIARPTVTYFFNPVSYLGLGLYFSYNFHPGQGNAYRMVDETENNYYSQLQGFSKLKVFEYGVRVSYSHSIFIYHKR